MHVMSPLRFQKHSERRTYIKCTEHKRTGLCEYGRNSRKDEGLLGILTGAPNRWWRAIEMQREHRRERGVNKRRRNVRLRQHLQIRLAAILRSMRWARPPPWVSINTDQWQVGTCPLLQQHLVVPHHRLHLSHRSQRTGARAYTFALSQRSPSVSRSLRKPHARTGRSLTNVGTDAPHQTAVGPCSLRASRETEEYC